MRRIIYLNQSVFISLYYHNEILTDTQIFLLNFNALKRLEVCNFLTTFCQRADLLYLRALPRKLAARQNISQHQFSVVR
jgi:hypothetical protein